MIHKTAIIDESAIIDETVEIGPNVVIGKNVKIKKGTKILAGSFIECAEIGENCKIGPMSVIGAEPQDLGYKGEPTKVIIGDNCWIREFATVHRASGEGATVVGNKCLLQLFAR